MPKAKPSYIYNQQMIKIMIGVYKITSLKNKIYVGQTVDLERRKNTYKALNVGVKGQPKLYNSLLKHGWEQHTFEIIEECSEEQLDEREIYWGTYYDVLGKNGLNLKIGNGKGLLSNETKLKISNKHKGMKKPWAGKNLKLTPEHKEKLNSARKLTSNPIFQYDLEGKFIKEWLNPKQASDVLQINNGYLSTILDTNNTSGGFRFTSIKEEKLCSTTKWEGIKKPVLQYDINGNFIKEWNSAIEASKTLNIAIQHITACCRGERKKTFNNKFTYKK
jgi:group I intron endonuclease